MFVLEITVYGEAPRLEESLQLRFWKARTRAAKSEDVTVVGRHELQRLGFLQRQKAATALQKQIIKAKKDLAKTTDEKSKKEKEMKLKALESDLAGIINGSKKLPPNKAMNRITEQINRANGTFDDWKTLLSSYDSPGQVQVTQYGMRTDKLAGLREQIAESEFQAKFNRTFLGRAFSGVVDAVAPGLSSNVTPASIADSSIAPTADIAAKGMTDLSIGA